MPKLIIKPDLNKFCVLIIILLLQVVFINTVQACSYSCGDKLCPKGQYSYLADSRSFPDCSFTCDFKCLEKTDAEDIFGKLCEKGTFSYCLRIEVKDIKKMDSPERASAAKQLMQNNKEKCIEKNDPRYCRYNMDIALMFTPEEEHKKIYDDISTNLKDLCLQKQDSAFCKERISMPETYLYSILNDHQSPNEDIKKQTLTFADFYRKVREDFSKQKCQENSECQDYADFLKTHTYLPSYEETEKPRGTGDEDYLRERTFAEHKIIHQHLPSPTPADRTILNMFEQKAYFDKIKDDVAYMQEALEIRDPGNLYGTSETAPEIFLKGKSLNINYIINDLVYGKPEADVMNDNTFLDENDMRAIKLYINLKSGKNGLFSSQFQSDPAAFYQKWNQLAQKYNIENFK